MRSRNRDNFISLQYGSISRNNCIRLTTNLRLDIYKNFTFFRSLLRWERKKEERGRGRGRCQLNEELIDIQNLNHQNYVNSQIILPAKKLTNLERQARDGGRHSEERCIFQAQTTAPEGFHAIICLMQIGTLG